ncbi:hypothetical protein [Chitinimonas koreensis]|uniref:hypothetical protein n=1 Tax=Chitinimonas koreensis TaxID=356302 RepID=UPI00223FF609|nr:hypothetical protein [Chitinimonas koreensis]
MAVFSSVGLAAAFLTVLCWFPAFDRGELPLTRFSARFADTLGRWPRWRPPAAAWRWPPCCWR